MSGLGPAAADAGLETVSDDEGPLRWVVYSSFDAEGRLAPHAVDQLQAYRRAGFATLVVDTSPLIGEARRQSWQDAATAWFQRPNVGYDFQSFNSGLKHLTGALGVDIARLHLILANDSCFGPFLDLEAVLASFRDQPGRCVFGITDSFEVHYHLQSYWLYFRPDVAPLAQQILATMPVASGRLEAIETGELALSRLLRDHHCELRAYAPVADTLWRFSHHGGSLISLMHFALRRIVKRPLYTRRADGACLKLLLRRENALAYVNPTLDYGVAAFRAGLTPFVKKSLLRDNPSDDPSVPVGVDVASLSNADVQHLLGRHEGRPNPVRARRH